MIQMLILNPSLIEVLINVFVYSWCTFLEGSLCLGATADSLPEPQHRTMFKHVLMVLVCELLFESCCLDMT